MCFNKRYNVQCLIYILLLLPGIVMVASCGNPEDDHQNNIMTMPPGDTAQNSDFTSTFTLFDTDTSTDTAAG